MLLLLRSIRNNGGNALAERGRGPSAQSKRHVVFSSRRIAITEAKILLRVTGERRDSAPLTEKNGAEVEKKMFNLNLKVKIESKIGIQMYNL